MTITTLFCQKLLRLLALFFLLSSAHMAQAQWAEVLAGTPNTLIWNTVIDPAGNVTVAGDFQGTLTIGTITLTSRGYQDIFVARRSATGVWEWAVSGGGGTHDYVDAIILLPNGDVCLAGECNGSSSSSFSALFGTTALTGEQSFLAKITSAGQWNGVTGMGLLNGASVRSLALEPVSGDLLVGGVYFGTNVVLGPVTLPGYSEGVFVGRLSTGLQWRWVEPVRVWGNGGTAQGGTVTSDGSGGVIVSGYVANTINFGATTLTTTSGYFIAHLTAGRTWQWARLLQCPGYQGGAGHTVDPVGNIYLTGLFMGTMQFGATTLNSVALSIDLFVAKLDVQGQWQWAKQIGGLGSDGGSAICADNNGSVYVGGWFTDSILTGFPLPFAGGYDGMVLRFDSNGIQQAATAIGNSGVDIVYSLSLNPTNGHLVVNGLFDSPTLSLSSHTLTHTGGTGTYSSFLADISSQLLSTPTAAAASTALTLSPNPAHGALWLTLPANGATTGTMLDGVGRTVRTFPLTGERIRLDIQGVAPGVYTIRVGAQTRRVVVE